MSEAKLISPLLDRFAIGDAISEHHGVRCYPAMREDSDDKYIVKVISIPASQVQLEALLLTGAYRDQDSALAYFRELADGTVHEAETLQGLARLEGFVTYEGWQVVPMEDGVGFQVYLLGSYKRSLERYLRRHPMTQLAAVNLGLDICAALAVCRRAGYLYVDLKPENIFLSANHSYQIGDLGLVALDSLKYASLPEKYRSSYTPPEIGDAFASLNLTVDTYALGLILYQAYNDSKLPADLHAPAAPIYADYEMAEIILKACAPDPADRWQSPEEMGQALVGYMQRNGANDTAIIPIPGEPNPPVPVKVPAEEPLVEVSPTVEEPVEDASLEESAPAEAAEEVPSPEPEALEQIEIPEFMQEEDPPLAEAPAELPEETAEEAFEETEETPAPAADTDLSFIDSMISDETAPTDETAIDLDDAVISEEMSQILAQADDLIAHEMPEPVVAPDPIEVPMPEPIVLEAEVPEGSDEAAAGEEVPEAEAPPAPAEEPEESEEPPKKKRGKGWIALLIVLALLAGAAYGGYYYYENYYLQTVTDLTLEGFEDQLTVQLYTQIPDASITVTCTDTYGISSTAGVTNGKAQFTGLNPATTYKISVTIDGFHELRGKTTASYTTASKTNIVSFNAITGAADGSVILSFTPDGPDSEEWTVAYSTEGETEKTQTFTGHNVTVTGLTVGKAYTFRLIPAEGMYLQGNDTLTFTADKVIYAENLRFTALEDHSLTLAWDAPEGVTGQIWTLTHYDQVGEILSMVTLEDTTITLNLEDLTQSHTFEVLADGMTQSAKISLSANPVTITGVNTDASNYPKMYLQWSYEGSEPAGGWIVTVRANGSEPLATLHCETSSAEIDTLIPGASYTLEFQTADGSNLFQNSFGFEVPAAEGFDDYWVTGSNFTLAVCRKPELAEWTHKDLTDESFPASFQVGEKTALSLTLDRSYELSYDQIIIVLVIRDSNGLPVSADSYSMKWDDMFYTEDRVRYGDLAIPTMPATEGDYSLELYFNGAFVGNTNFKVG